MQSLRQLLTYGLIFFSLLFTTTISAMEVGSETTRALAEQGDARAQNQLAWDYISIDYNKAFEWRVKAANQGYAPAQFSVGQNYYFGPSKFEGPTKGQGVSQDYSEAFKWYMKAANQGHSESQISLGIMYREGYGVRQDHTKAIQWFKKADNARGLLMIGRMYRYGEGVKKDKAVAKELFGKVCDQGFQSGCDAYRELNQR